MFWFAVIMLFFPIISIVIYSFNDSKRITIWRGFTFNNYTKAFFDLGLREAFINSLTIAAASTVISLVLGIMSAYLLWRFRFWGRTFYGSMLSLPIVVPEICMGVSLLLFFNKVFGGISLGSSWPANLILIIIAHVTFCFPFVSMVISARINLYSFDQLEAAFDLGANEVRAFFDVVLPFLKPALIASAMLAFTLSLDDFVITFFTSGPDSVTFPVKVYSMLRFSVTPVVNAASTILIVITVLLTLGGMAVQKKVLID
ncbi:MAG: ABC transporter permease [SAR324 cluster bacterium]|nr:ABC transporter permease [SAR324 cluster bacterium]